VYKTKASDCSLYTKVRMKAAQRWSHKSAGVIAAISAAATITQELILQAFPLEADSRSDG
jgi:hypothetical protein